jgi:hypothetical protein
MDILWPAIGIGLIVGFIFFVLAQHWRKVLERQTWTIRRLAERVRDLEDMADPEFRRRLVEASPLPLEQVYTLTFRLNDRFWRALHITEENLRFIREFGSLVGSVKLDRWRSHMVATVAEVLPDRKETGWQMRSLDFYPDPAKPGRGITLWELALEPTNFTAEQPPSLELVLRENSIDLLGHLALSQDRANGPGGNGTSGANGKGDRPDAAHEEALFFRVPLDTYHLGEFRGRDPSSETGNDNERGSDEVSAEAQGAPAAATSWQAFYSGGDEALGIEWQLRLRDLTEKSLWDRWKILESTTVPPGAGRR